MSETFGPLKVVRNAEPEAKQTFLIVDKSTSRALTCHNGRLYLEDGTDATANWQWRCATTGGFLGFENVAEGTFLGHDIWWNIQAKTRHLLGWERFIAEKRSSGGYWIKALNWWTFWQLSARTDNSGLYAERDDGTLWEFVKVCRG